MTLFISAFYGKIKNSGCAAIFYASARLRGQALYIYETGDRDGHFCLKRHRQFKEYA